MDTRTARFAFIRQSKGWTCPDCRTYWRMLFDVMRMVWVRVEPVGLYSMDTACDGCRPFVEKQLKREGRAPHPGTVIA